MSWDAGVYKQYTWDGLASYTMYTYPGIETVVWRKQGQDQSLIAFINSLVRYLISEFGINIFGLSFDVIHALKDPLFSNLKATLTSAFVILIWIWT